MWFASVLFPEERFNKKSGTFSLQFQCIGRVCLFLFSKRRKIYLFWTETRACAYSYSEGLTPKSRSLSLAVALINGLLSPKPSVSTSSLETPSHPPSPPPRRQLCVCNYTRASLHTHVFWKAREPELAENASPLLLFFKSMFVNRL